MNIITNESLIKNNRRFGLIFMFGGMIILGAGLFISIRFQDLKYIQSISLGTLIFGFILSQLGFFFMNRWGRNPRADELLNQSLKGLDGKYMLYHYTTPASHLLIGPAGLWVLSPRFQQGTITFSKGRWHQRGGNLYLKLFAQQGLGRPDMEISYEVEKIQNILRKKISDEKIPPVQAALIFVSDKVNLQVDEDENPPAATLDIKHLKEFIRKTAKNKPISLEKAEEIQKIFS